MQWLGSCRRWGTANAAELLSVLEKAYSITYDKDHYLKQDRK